MLDRKLPTKRADCVTFCFNFEKIEKWWNNHKRSEDIIASVKNITKDFFHELIFMKAALPSFYVMSAQPNWHKVIKSYSVFSYLQAGNVLKTHETPKDWKQKLTHKDGSLSWHSNPISAFSSPC